MRISAGSSAYLNWDVIEEQMQGEAATAIKTAVEHAKVAFEALKSGEAKTISINVGSLHIKRPKA